MASVSSGRPTPSPSTGTSTSTQRRKDARFFFYRQIFTSTIQLACSPNGEPYYYQGGVYRRGAEAMAKRWLLDQMDQNGDSTLWGTAAESFIVALVRTEASRQALTPWPKGYINCRNGWVVLEPDGPKLYGHMPAIRTVNQLPVDFNPTATCPRIREFMDFVLGEEAPDFLPQVVAWMLHGSNPRQKAILLTGKAGNGKSTFLNVVQRFLGEENFSIDSLQALMSNQFALSQLYGKLGHMCPDLPKDKLPGMEVLKQLTGDDPIAMEAKWRDRTYFRSHAKLLFSCNGAPAADGADAAFWDRWQIVPFNRRIRGTSRQRGMTDFLDEICTPEELSGLLNWALEHAPAVWTAGVTETDAQKAMVRLYAKMQSVVDRWACDTFFADPAKSVGPEDLQSSFNLWCRRRMESPKGYSAHDLVTAVLQVGGEMRDGRIHGVDWLANQSLMFDELRELEGAFPVNFPKEIH